MTHAEYGRKSRIDSRGKLDDAHKSRPLMRQHLEHLMPLYLVDDRQRAMSGLSVNPQPNPIVTVPAFSTPSPVAVNLTQIVSVCMATYFFIFDVKDSMKKEIRKALKTAAAAVEAGAACRSAHFLPCPALHRPAAVLRSEALAEGASLARS
jgi:hypothetical protein